MTVVHSEVTPSGGTSRFPLSPSTGPLARTGGFTAGKRA
jgi:hypothetical protein